MTKAPLGQFAILKAAKVLPGYFARHFGFGRVSVSMWVNGRAEPHPLHRSAVLGALEKVKTAYDAGRLPLAGPVARKDAFLRFVDAIEPKSE